MTTSVRTCDCGGLGEVTETRPSTGGTLRRRIRCQACSRRWTTCEMRVDEGRAARGNRVVFLPRRKLTATEALALVASLIDADEAEPSCAGGGALDPDVDARLAAIVPVERRR